MLDIDGAFRKGILRPNLFLGIACSISAETIGVNLSEAGRPSGSHFSGSRYGRGEVGEFVLVEGQSSLVLGRISEVRLHEQERRIIGHNFEGIKNLDAIGNIQLLGSICMDSLRVTPGIETYPRLGDRIYAAPHKFIALLPRLMEPETANEGTVLLDVGMVDLLQESTVSIKPERLFGRHCAILGTTGGGKSWTIARIIEECCKHKSKLILIDATGEYRSLVGDKLDHCHLCDPINKAENSTPCSLPPTNFLESDFIALFEPAGKVQGPKMRAAIKSLRLAKLIPALSNNGCIRKPGQLKKPIMDAELDPEISSLLDNPRQAFDVSCLVRQIEEECVWPTGGTQKIPDLTKWGSPDESSFAHCLSLISRINGVLTSPAFSCVFRDSTAISVSDKIDSFITDDNRLLRICLSAVGYEFRAREIIANAIGRYLLTKARAGFFQEKPTVIIVDEAHNFLGRQIGEEDYLTKLDSFELIAKEGRKYGLNICLASQRPRDITEGVLSQMGTLIVHRLTNDRDREVVERACGEIDRAVSAFLPNLRPGQAAIIGADFPIPLTIQIREPDKRPESDSPNYEKYWAMDVGI